MDGRMVVKVFGRGTARYVIYNIHYYISHVSHCRASSDVLFRSPIEPFTNQVHATLVEPFTNLEHWWLVRNPRHW